MARRTRFNFGLQRAVECSAALRKPLVVLEALRCDYPWASDRFHQFVLEGMAGQPGAPSRRAGRSTTRTSSPSRTTAGD